MLQQDVAHHLINVLKLREGELVHVFDGNRGYYQSEIIRKDKKTITIRTDKYINDDIKSNLNLTLVQGISRGQKMDYTIQKAVEPGLTHIVPLLSEFRNVRLDPERAEKKESHWQKVIINACEQCGRNKVPKISFPTSLQKFVESDTNEHKIVLRPGSTQSFNFNNTEVTNVTLVCGPEGGLSSNELKICEQSDYKFLSLGPRILRTETAAIAAITMCQSNWGDIQ